jgi:glycosyltransferase involved in cell wall biosynthesis
MQAIQTGSRYRGIGRYAMSFTHALLRNKNEDDEIILALNGAMADTIMPLRRAFEGALDKENIRVWHPPYRPRHLCPYSLQQQEINEVVREAFLQSLHPDVILVISLFEESAEDAVTSVHKFDLKTPVAVVLHDLIPLVFSEEYLDKDYKVKLQYLRKIDSLKKSDLLLSVSKYSGEVAAKILPFDAQKIVPIAAACDETFRKTECDDKWTALKGRLGIEKNCVFYVGALEERKNLSRLVQAFAQLPDSLRVQYQLVLAGKGSSDYILALRQRAEACRLKKNDVLFPGSLSDDDIITLYNKCALFVFPSLYEGFGLPPLEAMACGAPTIAADTSSLTEVLGLAEATFDPYSVQSIGDAMRLALTDAAYRDRLLENGRERAASYSWDKTAQTALSALKKASSGANSGCFDGEYDIAPLLKTIGGLGVSAADGIEKRAISAALARNFKKPGTREKLFLDVGFLATKSDISSQLKNFFRTQDALCHYTPVPVYFNRERGAYLTASFFSLTQQSQVTGSRIEKNEDIIDFYPGDIFLCFNPDIYTLQYMKNIETMSYNGVIIKFILQKFTVKNMKIYNMFKKYLLNRWFKYAYSFGKIYIHESAYNKFEDIMMINCHKLSENVSIFEKLEDIC